MHWKIAFLISIFLHFRDRYLLEHWFFSLFRREGAFVWGSKFGVDIFWRLKVACHTNIFCHLISRIYHYENFSSTKTFVSLRFVSVFHEILEFNSTWHPLQTLRVSEKNSYAHQSYGRLNGIFNFTLASMYLNALKDCVFDINSATLSRPVGIKYWFFSLCTEGAFVLGSKFGVDIFWKLKVASCWIFFVI